jgi:hypothetical protein
MWKNITKRIESGMDFTQMLKNHFVLYLLLFIALFNMYSYVTSGEQLYIAFMLIIGFLTSFFSKNMIVVLFLSIVIPNIIHYGSEIRVREGFAGTDAESEAQESTTTPDKLTEIDITDLTDKKGINSAMVKTKVDKIKNNLGAMRTRLKSALATSDKIADEDKKTKVKGLLQKQHGVMDSLEDVISKYNDIMMEVSNAPELSNSDFNM